MVANAAVKFSSSSFFYSQRLPRDSCSEVQKCNMKQIEGTVGHAGRRRKKSTRLRSPGAETGRQCPRYYWKFHLIIHT